MLKSPLSLNFAGALLGAAAMGAILGFFLARISQKPTILLAPVTDNKVEQYYRRSGLNERLMSVERRKAFSECYKSFLRNNGYSDVNPTPKPLSGGVDPNAVFEGKATFVFHIGEDGTLLDYEAIDSDFSDQSFVRCLSRSVKGVRFLPPPLGINRYLSYDLVFKSDETFKKDIEERKGQSPLMLITPTPNVNSEKPPTPSH